MPGGATNWYESIRSGVSSSIRRQAKTSVLLPTTRTTNGKAVRKPQQSSRTISCMSLTRRARRTSWPSMAVVRLCMGNPYTETSLASIKALSGVLTDSVWRSTAWIRAWWPTIRRWIFSLAKPPTSPTNTPWQAWHRILLLLVSMI